MSHNLRKSSWVQMKQPVIMELLCLVHLDETLDDSAEMCTFSSIKNCFFHAECWTIDPLRPMHTRKLDFFSFEIALVDQLLLLP